jgi:hypothetical protein
LSELTEQLRFLTGHGCESVRDCRDFLVVFAVRAGEIHRQEVVRIHSKSHGYIFHARVLYSRGYTEKGGAHEIRSIHISVFV